MFFTFVQKCKITPFASYKDKKKTNTFTKKKKNDVVLNVLVFHFKVRR